MAVPSAYLTTAKSVKDVLAAMQTAGVPKKFTYDFLKQLGYPSSSNRPVIAVLKALRFPDDSGAPTERYRRYKDPKQAQVVLAEAMRDAYADVFTVNQDAYTLTTTELKGVFARLSDKGDSVNEKMAITFKTLADMADFQAAAAAAGTDGGVSAAQTGEEQKQIEVKDHGDVLDGGAIVIHHDVHIHLPPTTDIAVYDAIFRSLRENLRT
jgi:hypothetical protein